MNTYHLDSFLVIDNFMRPKRHALISSVDVNDSQISGIGKER